MLATALREKRSMPTMTASTLPIPRPTMNSQLQKSRAVFYQQCPAWLPTQPHTQAERGALVPSSEC
jgi:hypothetical protein